VKCKQTVRPHFVTWRLPLLGHSCRNVELPWPWSRWVGRYRALAFGLAAAPLALFAGNDSSILADKPVVGKNADGHIEVFKVDPAGELFHRWQKVADGNWSRWVSLGRGIQPEQGT
jgi:hypothetical protein